MKKVPSLDEWIHEVQTGENANRIGICLTHTGLVRATSRKQVQEGILSEPTVTGMRFSYDSVILQELIDKTLAMDGIFAVKAWLNEGELKVGECMMKLLVAGDTRRRTMEALKELLNGIKTVCVHEEEEN